MKIQDIIRTIEMQKADFQSRYKVEPNICALSEDLYLELDEYFKSRIENADAFGIDKVCGMSLSINTENENSVQVGYFSKPCRTDWEV